MSKCILNRYIGLTFWTDLNIAEAEAVEILKIASQSGRVDNAGGNQVFLIGKLFSGHIYCRLDNAREVRRFY